MSLLEKTNWDKYLYTPNSVLDVSHYPFLLGYKRLLQKIQQKIHSIVELGCGSGKLTKDVAAIFRPSKITLVDFNTRAISTCSKIFKKEEHVDIVYSDFFRLQLDQQFDFVHSCGVLEHFQGDEQHRLMRIHADLTKEDGYVLVFTPTPTALYKIIRFVAEKVRLWIFPDEVPLTKNDLLEIGRKAELVYISHTFTYFPFTSVGILFQKSRYNSDSHFEPCLR